VAGGSTKNFSIQNFREVGLEKAEKKRLGSGACLSQTNAVDSS